MDTNGTTGGRTTTRHGWGQRLLTALLALLLIAIGGAAASYGTYRVDHQAMAHALHIARAQAATTQATALAHRQATVLARAEATMHAVREGDAAHEVGAVATAQARAYHRAYRAAIAAPTATAHAQDTAIARSEETTVAGEWAAATATAIATPGYVIACTGSNYDPSSWQGCTVENQTMGVHEAQDGQFCVERTSATGTAYYTVAVEQQQMDGSLRSAGTPTSDSIPADSDWMCYNIASLVPNDLEGLPVAAAYTFDVTLAGVDLPAYRVIIHE